MWKLSQKEAEVAEESIEYGREEQKAQGVLSAGPHSTRLCHSDLETPQWCPPGPEPASPLIGSSLPPGLGCNQLRICLSFQTACPRGQGLYSPRLLSPPWLRREQLSGQLSAVPRHVPFGHAHAGSLLLSKQRPLVSTLCFLKASSAPRQPASCL